MENLVMRNTAEKLQTADEVWQKIESYMKMFHCIDDRQTRNQYFQRTFQSDISKTLESQCPKKNHVTISEN